MEKKIIKDLSGYNREGFNKLIENHNPPYIYHKRYPFPIVSIFKGVGEEMKSTVWVDDEHLIFGITDLYDTVNKWYDLSSLYFYTHYITIDPEKVDPNLSEEFKKEWNKSVI